MTDLSLRRGQSLALVVLEYRVSRCGWCQDAGVVVDAVAICGGVGFEFGGLTVSKSSRVSVGVCTSSGGLLCSYAARDAKCGGAYGRSRSMK